MARSLPFLLVLPAAALITYACGGANNSGVLPNGGAGETGTGGKGSNSGGSDNGSGGNDNTAGSATGGTGPAIVTCQSDKDCTATDQVCDVPRLVCVECLTATDCGEDADCEDGKCQAFVPCVSSKDCSADQVCDKTLARCVECIGANDCDAGQLCINSECRPTCASDKDCSALDQVCDTVGGYCVGCMTNDDCAPSQYCGASNECVADVCQSGSVQCSGDALMTCNAAGTGFDQQACPDGCVSDDGPAHCDDGMLPGTCQGATADPCTSIPRLTVPQVVDGSPDEFCNVPYKVLTPANAGYLVNMSGAATTPDGKTSQAQVRLAWSPGYLHAYVRVVDPAIYVSSSYPYQGDNVQIFATPAAPSVSAQLVVGGCFTPLTQEQQIFLVPSDGVAASYVQFSCTGWAPSAGAYEYTSQPTSDGYAVELKYPWGATTAGSQVGIDVLIGVNDTGVRDYEYALYLGVPSASSTCTGNPGPWCDPKLWCSPTLGQ